MHLWKTVALRKEKKFQISQKNKTDAKNGKKPFKFSLFFLFLHKLATFDVDFFVPNLAWNHHNTKCLTNHTTIYTFFQVPLNALIIHKIYPVN